MAQADPKFITFRPWADLAEYERQKIAEVKDVDSAHRLILRAWELEHEWLLPYRFKSSNDITGRWFEDGLPRGYYFSDARIDWATSSAHWAERMSYGLGRLLPELHIYHIQVVVPIEIAAEPVVETAKAPAKPAAVEAEPPKRAVSSRRTRRRTKPQQSRARRVLRKLYPPDGCPSDEVSNKDLLAQCKDEYTKMVSSKELSPSRWPPPSDASYLREVGRKE